MATLEVNERSYSEFDEIFGFRFPSYDSSTAYCVPQEEVSAEATWLDGDWCADCGLNFTPIKRRHHCRKCGNVVCNDCSTNKSSIPIRKIFTEVRVCKPCYIRLEANKNAALNVSNPFSPSTAALTPYTSSNDQNKYNNTPHISSSTSSHEQNRADIYFEEDLRKAIELSLDEAKKHDITKRATTTTTKFTTTNQNTSSNTNNYPTMNYSSTAAANLTPNTDPPSKTHHNNSANFAKQPDTHNDLNLQLSKLDLIKEARKTLDDLKSEHLDKLRQQKEEAEMFLRIQMEQKMELTRQQKKEVEDIQKSLQNKLRLNIDSKLRDRNQPTSSFIGDGLLNSKNPFQVPSTYDAPTAMPMKTNVSYHPNQPQMESYTTPPVTYEVPNPSSYFYPKGDNNNFNPYTPSEAPVSQKFTQYYAQQPPEANPSYHQFYNDQQQQQPLQSYNQPLYYYTEPVISNPQLTTYPYYAAATQPGVPLNTPNTSMDPAHTENTVNPPSNSQQYNNQPQQDGTNAKKFGSSNPLIDFDS